MLRARLELVFAGIFAILAVVTAIWPTWIESLFEVSPDGGSGETEIWIVLAFAALAVVAALLARRDFLSVKRRRLGDTNTAQA